MSEDGLLDSGASHVIIPLEALTQEEKQQASKVSLSLASGKPQLSVIHEGEVCAPRVRRVLLPLGKLIRQCGLVALWSKKGMNMVAPDKAGNLRVVCRPTLRQGGMPHVSQEEVEAFRNMLKATRMNPRTVRHEEWAEVLSLAPDATDTCFQLLEDNQAIGTGGVEEESSHVMQEETEGSLNCSIVCDNNDLVCKVGQVDCNLSCVCPEEEAKVEQIACNLSCACPEEEGKVEQIACNMSSACGVGSSDGNSPTMVACKSQARTSKIAGNIVEHCMVRSVPTTHSRTNLGYTRSSLIGAYTRRGCGIAMKPRWSEVLPWLHELASECSIRFPYTSISINLMRNCAVKEHVDYNNLGQSYVFVCGQFEGGSFRQGKTQIRAQDSWFEFWGQWPHSVDHVDGCRVSIVYYMPNRLYALQSRDWDRLRHLGFPVDEVLRVSIPKLVASASTAFQEGLDESSLCDVRTSVAGNYVLVEYACYPDSALSKSFEEKGGVSYRLGLHNIDLATEEGHNMFKRLIRQVAASSQGSVVWFSLPCSPWSRLQALNAHKFGASWLEAKREESMPLLRFALASVIYALRHGVQVVWEWPLHCDGWKQHEVQVALSSLSFECRVDGCAYGLKHQGEPVKKPWKLCSSLSLSSLDRRCSCKVTHRACESGRHVADSARYTQEMVCVAAECLLESLSNKLCSEDIACARAGELSDDDQHDEHNSVYDEDDGDDVELPIHDDDDSDGEEIETSKRSILSEPREVGSDGCEEFSSRVWLEHVENDHFPKLSWCPICQWAEGTTFSHRKLHRTEVGMLAVDLAGPIASDVNGKKYIVSAIFVSYHNHRELVLPFVELVGSRLAEEVVDVIGLIVQHVNALTSSVLPKMELGVSRVHRVHTDRASEFLSKTAAKWARENRILWTKTGGHSFPSNGRAEVGIRHLKSVTRRAMLSSKMDMKYWGYCCKHVAETLRSHRLRKAGDTSYPQPECFGSYVAVRIPGNSKSFKPFQPRGRLGRLLYHDMSERKCFILDAKGSIWYGFAAVTVTRIEDVSQQVPDELIQEGWTKVLLASGLEGWYNAELSMFRMLPPTIAVGTEELQRVDVDVPLTVAQLAAVSTCQNGSVELQVPDVGMPSEHAIPDDASQTDMSKDVAAARERDIDSIASGSYECCSGPCGKCSPESNEESCCCSCGGLVDIESGFECWVHDCNCWVHLQCCVIYPTEEGGTTIGCP
eukprot:6484268-Amphidinium_carterae.1